MQPFCLDDIFKSKYTSEHKAEKGGKDTGKRDDPRKINFFEFVEQSAPDCETESLANISEHGAEDKGVSQREKNRRIHLIVCRKSVHTDKHLKWLEDLRVLQLCRRLPEIGLVVIFHHYKQVRIVLDVFEEGTDVSLGHPSA